MRNDIFSIEKSLVVAFWMQCVTGNDIELDKDKLWLLVVLMHIDHFLMLTPLHSDSEFLKVVFEEHEKCLN